MTTRAFPDARVSHFCVGGPRAGVKNRRTWFDSKRWDFCPCELLVMRGDCLSLKEGSIPFRGALGSASQRAMAPDSNSGERSCLAGSTPVTSAYRLGEVIRLRSLARLLPGARQLRLVRLQCLPQWPGRLMVGHEAFNLGIGVQFSVGSPMAVCVTGHACTKGASWPCKPAVVGSIPTVSTTATRASRRILHRNLFTNPQCCHEINVWP